MVLRPDKDAQLVGLFMFGCMFIGFVKVLIAGFKFLCAVEELMYRSATALGDRDER